jgi:MtrB/PioB family decaheme-associated outer membrane protein
LILSPNAYADGYSGDDSGDDSGDYALTPERIGAVDTERWGCRFCPDEAPRRGEVAVSVRRSDEPVSARFRDRRGSDDGWQTGVSGELHGQTDDQRGHASAEDLGADNPRLAASYRGGAGFEADLELSRINVYGERGGISIYPEGDSATLDPTWIRQSSTATMIWSPQRDIEAYRRRGELQASVMQTIGDDLLALSAGYRHLEREGTRWERGSILNDVSSFTEARQDQTRELTLGVSVPLARWSAGQGVLAFEYFRSEYENARDRLEWDNPFLAALPGADRGQRAAPPDNEFSHFLVSGHYQQGVHRFSVSLQHGEGAQKESLLPYTVNALLTPAALPALRFNGRVDTRQLRLGWDFRPSAQLALAARVRHGERENRSEQLDYTPVLTDSLLQGAQRNDLNSHQQTALQLGATWRPRSGRALDYTAELEHFERERTGSAAADTLTTTLGWSERWTRALTTRLNLSGSERRQDRDGSVLAPGQNPHFDEFTVSDRERNRIAYVVQWQPDRAFSLRSELALQRDRYPATEVGVTESQDRLLGIQLDWQLSRALSARFAAQRNRMLWAMRGSTTGSFATWDSRQLDRYDVVSVGLHRTGLFEGKADLGLDYVYLDGCGQTRVEASDYEELKHTGQTIKGWVDYRWQSDWTVHFEALYEHVRSANPLVPDLATLPNMLGSGIDDEHYGEWLFGLRVGYGFRQ